MTFDTIVVGAGAAGLAAARRLGRAGRSVLVLEARDRAGGRMYAVVDPRAGAPVELGPEWVHGRPAVTEALLREIGMPTIEDSGTSFEVDEAGRLVEQREDPFERAGAALARCATAHAGESVADLLARETSARGVADARLAARLVAGFDAADPARASAREIAEEWSGDAVGGGSQSRPSAGYAPVVAHLVRSLDRDRVALRFGACVHTIAWSEDGVRVGVELRGERVNYRARRAIVSAPIGVLQAAPGERGAIAFEPALPADAADAIAGIAMGPVVKVVMRFRTAFWERLNDGRFFDGAFFSAAGAFPTFWTQMPVRASMLTAWAGGPDADALAALDRDATVARAVAEAGRMFAASELAVDECEAAYYHDWQRDPWSRGAYSYVLAGGEGSRERLAMPLADGALWFAGEATAGHGEGGTVAGALQSGERAAEGILSLDRASRRNVVAG